MSKSDPPPDAGMERAVEAALPIIRTARCGSNELNWCDAGMDCRCRVATTILIAAADHARGSSWIDWRSDMENAPRDRLIDILIGGKTRWCDCYYDQIYDQWRTSRPSGHPIGVAAKTATHWMMAPLLPGEMAEMPDMPDTLARTATDGDRSPRPEPPEDPAISAAANWLISRRYTAEAARSYAPDVVAAIDAARAHAAKYAPSATTRETPGQDGRAGGVIAVDRVERPPFKFTDDTEPTFEDRITALEQVGADTQEELMTQGDRIAALERRPGWTDEHATVLKYVAAHLGLADRGEWTETLAAARIAFPEPQA